MKKRGTPPPLPNARLRQIDLDAAVEEILQGLLKEKERNGNEARAANEKLERVVADTHHLSAAMGDLRERTGRADAFTHRAAGELLKLGHASAALLQGTASDSSISLMLVTELAHAMRRVESKLDAFEKEKEAPGVPGAPSPFEKEMQEAFRELSLPSPPAPPPAPPPLPEDADEDGASGGYAELPLSPIADNVFSLFPAPGTGGFDAMAVTTRAMKRANGPVRAMALACAALLATVAFAGSDSRSVRVPTSASPSCRYPAHADALPAQDARGRQVVLCDGEPSVVLRRNADGTIQFGPYES